MPSVPEPLDPGARERAIAKYDAERERQVNDPRSAAAMERLAKRHGGNFDLVLLEKGARREFIERLDEEGVLLDPRSAQVESGTPVQVGASIREPAMLLPFAHIDPLDRLRRIALLRRRFELDGNEIEAGFWGYFEIAEKFWLAHKTGNVYSVEISDGDVPSEDLAWALSEDIHNFFCEEYADEREWEAVSAHFRGDHDDAARLEEDAKDTRARARRRRRTIERRLRTARPQNERCVWRLPLRRGPRTRSTRGRAMAHRGSRRVSSRASGGGSDDPDPEPSARPGSHEQVTALAGRLA